MNAARATLTPPPRPFIKWVGGKTQLLPELMRRIPQSGDRYFEPFLGGAALFFHLQPRHAVLTDINADLVSLYQVIRDDVEALIADMGRHIYDKDYYYNLRRIDRTADYGTWTPVQRASRLIYLNKTCYNGLYRVNSKGQFNVPFGRYTNPTIVDAENLRACSQVLQGVAVEQADFRRVRDRAKPGDFVYFDPPYAPLSATANFTGYTKDGFDRDMQYALRDLCRELDQVGVRFMVSNSSAPLVRDLYAEFKVELVYATRLVNSKAGRRGKVPEVLVTNYT
ncbi:MAG: DNA adenine methylase [Cyanobacteria bacterium P01_A01_bin.135]